MKVINAVVASAVLTVSSLSGGCVAFGEPANDEVEPSRGSGMRWDAGTAEFQVFVTHERYRGNLTAYVSNAVNGLAAGDKICQLRAESAGLGGKWRAWLSSSELDAIDRITGNGPWQIIGFAVAFANRAQLQTEPTDPLNVDEHGEVIREPYGLTHVWTGTLAGGVHSAATCANWTSTLARGTFGHSKEGSFEWTDYSVEECDHEKHLVCLEQAL